MNGHTYRGAGWPERVPEEAAGVSAAAALVDLFNAHQEALGTIQVIMKSVSLLNESVAIMAQRVAALEERSR